MILASEADSLTGMKLPVIALPVVYHVGSLDPAQRGSVHHTSQEGAGLSVSLCPQAWCEIARISGELFALEHDEALYLDVLKIGRTEKRMIGEWAITAGLAAPSLRFRAWSYDPDGEQWRYALCDTREEAEAEVRADFNEDDDTPIAAIVVPEPLPRGHKLVESEAGLRLSEAGVRRAAGYGAAIDGFEFAAMFYAEDILMQSDPAIVGVWWRENFDPDLLSAPRGAIFQTRVCDMRASQLEWSAHEDIETVPRGARRSFGVPVAPTNSNEASHSAGPSP